MKILIQISIGLLFGTSLAYFAYRATDSLFFEEVYYFGFRGTILSMLLCIRNIIPFLRKYVDIAIAHAIILLSWEVFYSINPDMANSTPVIVGLFFASKINISQTLKILQSCSMVSFGNSSLIP